MSNNFKSIEKKLTSNGWQLVRISGSHHQYKKAGVSTLATIPNHGKKDIPIGILKSLEKQTGLSLRRQPCLFLCHFNCYFYFLTQRNFIDQMTSCRHRFVFHQ